MEEELSRLTERQRSVFDFIREKIQNRGYGPTVREIGEHFGIRSPNGVMCHLKALEKKGLIHRSPNKSRAIELVGEFAIENQGLPMVGEVAAGLLHEAVGDEQRFVFDEHFGKPGCFVLQVRGDSMIEAHIEDGDFAIVDPKRQPISGDVVVAQTDEGDATLKYWFPEAGRVRLQPANSTMQPIYVTNVESKGVVVGLVRKMGR